MPNDWTNLTARMRSLSEVKVVEYVLRHTWGYQEYGILKKISLDEFENGRKTAEGERIDEGIGMNRQAIISGIRQAVADGFLVEEKDETDKGRIRKYYGLRMKGDHLGGYENHTPGVGKSYLRGMKSTHRSEKETVERNLKKESVNGDLKDLPNCGKPEGQIDYEANHLAEKLGDNHSKAFYKLVARKVPTGLIFQWLSETLHDDKVRNPGAVFTSKVKRYASRHKSSR